MSLLTRISSALSIPRGLDNRIAFFEETCILLTIFFLPISKAGIQIGSTVAMLFWLIRILFFKKPSPALSSWIIRGFALFVFTGFLSLVFSAAPDWPLGARGIIKSLQHLGFLIVCLDYCDSPKKIFRIFKAFSFAMLIVTASGFYQLVTGFDFLRHSELDPGRVLRIKSCLNSPNALAAFYLFAIPAWLSLFPQERKKTAIENIFFWGVFISFVIAFILTFSRAAWLGAIAATGLVLILRKKWLHALVFSIALIITLAISQPLWINLVSGINVNDATVAERFRFWSYAWSMLSEHPWLGVGVNHYMTMLPNFIPESETYHAYAHNSYLQILAETGILGFLCFIIPTTLGLMTRFSGAKNEHTMRGLFLWVGCVAFLFHAFFDNHFFAIQPAFLFWGFFGVWLATPAHTASDNLSSAQNVKR